MLSAVYGFNQETQGTRWLAFTNLNSSQDIKGAVSASFRWHVTPATWTEPDAFAWFGPFVIARQAYESSFSPSDSQGISTLCMDDTLYEYC